MNKIVVCEDFKYRDFMFKNYVRESIKPRHLYRLMVEGDGSHYISLDIDGQENLIYISNLGKEVKDHRFVGKFSELDLNWILNNYLPECEDPQDLIDWLDGKYDVPPIEEGEGDVEWDQEQYDSVVDVYSALQAMTPKLSVGILEALSGVESILPGDLVDDEKGKLLEALNGVIKNYESNGVIGELYMAQYLLFNIISLAKNKW